MVDTPSPLILDGLRQAASAPEGLPLHGGRTQPGLFPTGAAGKNAARRCLEHGLLRVVGTETRGKSEQPLCTLSEQGLQLLLKESSTRSVLEALLQAVERSEKGFLELAEKAESGLRHLHDLKDRLAQALAAQGENPEATERNRRKEAQEDQAAIVACLQRVSGVRTLGDYPLPDLYRAAAGADWTIGRFHDALRGLQEDRRIALHPWTGPLYALPEPVFALMVGHEIAYYACSMETN